ncbi:MAG: hypothetical protein GAK35_04217 [Herbaspirillum frisingense]|uniref:Vesicle formation protein n=1 Tax=Herbaspirillum frisingense TaxID=92645 RepID=A0A7V8JSF3_9BURK|nr:MAG: hypothetical protein GAK35_04217 [Herbaspirillum frisingense]
MRAMKSIIVSLAAGLLSINAAHADICADMRTVYQQSQSHFDGWKKEGADSGGKAGIAYPATFMLDGADSCSISGNSSSYSCIWRFTTPADLGRAYQRMVNDIKACPPLVKAEAGILADKPQERTQGDLRQTMEVTGFDFADAEATLLLGQMQITGPRGLSRNELKLTFSRSAAH